ncbi:MAG: DUF5979 domain-containing protein [Propionibacteriaceae bacterium]
MAGDGADLVGDDDTFTVQLQCVHGVNGTDVPVAIEDDGLRELSRTDGLVAEYDGLLSGAVCTVTEPQTGGADETIISSDQLVIGVDESAEVEVVNVFNAEPEDPSDPGGPSDPSDPTGPADPDDQSAPGSSDPGDRGRLGDTGGPGLMLAFLGKMCLVGGAALLRRRHLN